MTEPLAQTIDDVIRARRDRDAGGDDRLRELRDRTANEEGVAEFSELLTGGNASQLRDSAIAIRNKLGMYGSPTLESAIAAQRRAAAERLSRLRIDSQ